MRIAIVSRGFSSFKGGAERFTFHLCEQLLKDGHEVFLFSGERPENIPSKLHFKKVHFNSFVSFLKILSFHWNVKKMLSEGSFDVVYGLCQFYPLHFFYAGGGVHRHWMKIRYPFVLFRFIKYIFSPVHLSMVWLENKIFNKNSTHIVICNSYLIKEHISRYYTFPQELIKVIYDGVDHVSFNPGVKSFRKTLRQQLHLSEKDFVILFVSNNWPRKGLDTIIEALCSLPENYKCLVVGRGKQRIYEKKLERLHLKNRVRFAGVCQEMPKYYGTADAFVLPTMYDPFAQVCREAMACGLPVITTNSNGASEIVEQEKNGFIMEKWNDSKKLCNYLLKLQNTQTLQDMSLRASQKALEFSWEKNLDEHRHLFYKKTSK